MVYNRQIRNSHKWVNEKCIHCGCVRIEVDNPNAKWNYKQYVNTETGEISKKITCITKQYEMNL